MEVLKFIVVWFICISKCSAMENGTMNLDKQLLKIQKREKQYLTEDDSNDRPQQKRDERQNTPSKSNLMDPKLLQKSLVHLQPKIHSSQLQPIRKSVLPKSTNIRIDTTPQRIPTKIPVVLKSAKVPTPAHALQLRIIKNRKNDSLPNSEILPNIITTDKITKIEDILTQRKDEDNQFKIDDKAINIKEDHLRPNKENEVILQQEKENTLKKDSESNLIKNKENGKIPLGEDTSFAGVTKSTQNKDDQVNLDKNLKKYPSEETEMASKPVVNVDNISKNENLQPYSQVTTKPIFLDDKADPIPTMVKKQTTSGNENAKKRKKSPYIIKEIPLTKKLNDKPTVDEIIQRRADHIDDNPDFVHISNGTHVLSIKKVSNHDRHKMQHSLECDEFDELQPPFEERIINEKPTKPLNENKEEENVLLASLLLTSNEKIEDVNINHNSEPNRPYSEENDPDDCITIINHAYEECKEVTTIPNAVLSPICNDVSQESWNYNQNYQNMYDQYGRYNVFQNGFNTLPTMGDGSYTLESNDPYAQIPEYGQEYCENENQPNITYFNNYESKPESVPYSYCSELGTENILERICRTWKEVEIKVRQPQNRNKPIDIRRYIIDNVFDLSRDCTNGNIITKTPIPYAAQPMGVNGYNNNQDSALIYPYGNPNCKYM